MITVIDVMRDLGVEPSNELSWSVGAHVRELWLNENGELPEKRLRNKTNDGGSHCFAIYPESWRERIIAVIAEHQTERARQYEMFVFVDQPNA